MPRGIRVGGSGWQYTHWRDDFYPAELPTSRWFAHYALTFNTVEINDSFYRLPPAKTFAKWREQLPPQWPINLERLEIFLRAIEPAGRVRAARGGAITGKRSLVQSRGVPMPAHLALTPAIDDFRRQFEQLADDADALVATLSDGQFAWQPAPNAWSIAQCIDHLNVTARLYLPLLDEGIANAIRQGSYGEGPFTYWWLARMFVRMLEPPPRPRMKAPVRFQPPPTRARREIMAAFRAYQVQYVDRLRQANGLDLARARVRSVAASWIHMPLGTGFAVMTAHERRHLWQARQVMQAPGFPQ